MSYSTRLLLGLTLLLPLIAVPASAQKSPQPSDYERFITAISTGKIEVVQAEIDKGSDINAQDKDGKTPLWHAAHKGSPSPIVELLLDHGAQIEARDNTGVTALMAAVDTNQLAVVKLLLDRGAQVNARSNYGRTPLIIAAEPRHRNPKKAIAIVKLLLGAGANVDGRNPEAKTPLMVAAGDAYTPEIVPLLLDHGAEVDAHDRNGVTPLMFAVHDLGFPEIVKLLIEKGAQVDARSNSGSTPLHRAAQASTSMFRYIIVESNRSRSTAVRKESAKRPLNNAQLLLDKGAQVDARDEDGNTPLILAAKGSNRPKFIQLLIDKGAEVNVRNNDGWTPLMIAARGSGWHHDSRNENRSGRLILRAKGSDKLEFIQLFIEGGAEVNARNNDGWTPLMIAARWCNNSEIILWLLDNGADATAENKLGKKAIFYARDNNKALEDTRALERLEQLAGE